MLNTTLALSKDCMCLTAVRGRRLGLRFHCFTTVCQPFATTLLRVLHGESHRHEWATRASCGGIQIEPGIDLPVVHVLDTPESWWLSRSVATRWPYRDKDRDHGDGLASQHITLVQKRAISYGSSYTNREASCVLHAISQASAAGHAGVIGRSFI